MTPDADGLLYIDKPVGITSFDVIRTLRRTLNKTKLGHAGTLDPLASGLLIIGVGEGTKKLHALVGLDKVYSVVVRIGERRDTGDMEGSVLETHIPKELPRAAVDTVLKEIHGALRLPVPRYAAVKQGGEALYKKARRGEDFEPPLRDMHIYDIQVDDLTQNTNGFFELTCTMHVASGVYVRSVAEEIGRRLGYPATTQALRRTQIGEYTVANAERLDLV